MAMDGQPLGSQVMDDGRSRVFSWVYLKEKSQPDEELGLSLAFEYVLHPA